MNYYNEIKTTLIKNEAYKKVKDYSKNKSDLNAYFEVGRLLVEAQGGEEKAKYGNKLIKEYSEKLTKELGIGFSYIGHEIKIKIGNNYHYIDFLLFNYEFNSFIVVEIQITKMKAEHIGQLQKYINYVDKNIKKIHNDNTIGIIICKKEDKFVLEYCTDNRIFTTVYKLQNKKPILNYER